MDRWKSTGGKSQRREEKKKEKESKEEKMQVREKVGKAQNIDDFPMVWSSRVEK